MAKRTDQPPHLYRPGRAARSNDVGRFEPYARASFDDGWDMKEERQILRTEVSEEQPKSALSRNNSPDLNFDRSINPYRGCEHGCIYCFARPTHAYLGLSPGLDFETKLVARPGIAAVFAREISRSTYQVAPVALGTNTDPYQPIEAQYRLMREILQVCDRFNHPLIITTKGALIARDLDLLKGLAARNLVQVGLSLTSLDPGLSRRLEPRCPAPAKRLQVIAQLSAAGVPVRWLSVGSCCVYRERSARFFRNGWLSMSRGVRTRS